MWSNNVTFGTEAFVNNNRGQTVHTADTAARILAHSSIQIFSNSVRFQGCCWAKPSFSSLQRFSIGFRSGDWLGHSRTLIYFFWSHSLVFLAVCFGVVVMLEDPTTTHVQCSDWGKELFAQHLTIYGPFVLSVKQSTCLLCRKTPPEHDASTPTLHWRYGVLGMILLLTPPNSEWS